MRPFVRLVWKEARELLRPRYILPILLLPLIFVGMGQGFSGVEAQLGQEPTVSVVDRDGGEYGDVVVETLESRSTLAYRSTDGSVQTALNETSAAGGNAVIAIPGNFTERIESGERGRVHLYTTVESVSIVGIASSAQVEELLSASAHNVTVAVTGASEAQLDPIERDHTTYVKGRQLDAPPGVVSTAFTSQFIFVPVIIMLAIVFSGQMVMNSMASETEHKTLETLLAMPVERRSIVAAKLVGGSIVGLVATALYTAGIAFSNLSVGEVGGSSALTLGAGDYLLIGVSLFFTLVGTLALALCLGLFADSQQGAQMLLLPLSGLAIVPMFATMFTDVDVLGVGTKALLLAIPFTHPIIAPKRLLFDNTGLVLAGIGYEICFALAAVWLAVKLFESDRPITGNAGWLDRLLRLV
ncbi:ABC transporter permease [Halobacteriales archaeon QS_9_67_15]|nr:MAG: ABC transporter permease [Halobacteriales archaeon QS_9_67_15]